MLTKNEAEARVSQGATYLDRVRPSWFRQIDIGVLQLESCSQCIMGQLRGIDGNFGHGYDPAYGFDLYEEEMRGMQPDDRPAAFRPLQDAWIAAIAARLCPVSEPVVDGESTVVCLDRELGHATV